MIDIITFLIIYSTLTTIGLIKYYMKNKINYSNYINCLRALSDTDTSLKEHLEKEGKI